DAYTALTGKPDERRRSSQFLDARRLTQVLDVLWYLDWLLSAALGRVEGGKRGPKAGNVYWLVSNLDGIREQFTGKKLLDPTRMTLQRSTLPTSARLPMLKSGGHYRSGHESPDQTAAAACGLIRC